jgi:hypothetical protein
MDAWLEEMKDVQERMEAKIVANNEKSEVLQGTLISWMDIHHARTDANLKEIKAGHEMMMVAEVKA